MYKIYMAWSLGRRSGGKRSQDILNQQDTSEMGKVNICFDEQSRLSVVCHFRTGTALSPAVFVCMNSANVKSKGEDL